MNGGGLVLMARRRAGLTQRELAERLGCRQATIARWERGDRHPSFEDVEAVASACWLQLDTHLVREDRSWWPQIAMQLDRDPVERVRRLCPLGGLGAAAVLELLARSGSEAIVVGEVAGALHGWPLVLGGASVEVCARPGEIESLLGRPDARMVAEALLELAGGGQLVFIDAPSGTSGFRDLARGSESMAVGTGNVRVAALLDLLRIADASADLDARRSALAYRAVLEVQGARSEQRRGVLQSDKERIEAWLSRQTSAA